LCIYKGFFFEFRKEVVYKAYGEVALLSYRDLNSQKNSERGWKKWKRELS